MSNVRIRGKIPREEWPKIAERFRAGETLAEIARSYQCTAPAIRYIVGRVSSSPEQGRMQRDDRDRPVALAPDEGRRTTAQVVSVDRRASDGRPPAGTGSGGSSGGEIWDRIGSDIASFLAAMDSLDMNDSDDNYEALLLATDRLLWASARTRLELERVLDSRKTNSGKLANRRASH